MDQDVLGRRELETFQANLELQNIALLSTRCCSTGTCNGPATVMPYRLIETIDTTNNFSEPTAESIKRAFGPLRSLSL